MKKLFLFLLVMIITAFLSACGEERATKSSAQNFMVAAESAESSDDESSILFVPRGDWWNDDWVNPGLIYTEAVVPNKETALKVAQAVYDSLDAEYRDSRFIPRTVFYDDTDEVWTISFGRNPDDIDPPDGSTFVGPSTVIAIQKSDGKVLRIWYESDG